MMKALRVVYMGTSSFAVPALEALHRAGADTCTVLAAVTQPDRIRGRGGKILPTPVGAFAEASGLLLLKPERLSGNGEFFELLSGMRPDLIVVAAYGKILPKTLLELPFFGCINLHASILPEYRGAAPVQRAILDGKRETGVTLMHMEAGLDTGDIIAAAKTEIGALNAGALTERLSQMGAALLMENLPGLANGTAARISQREADATYAAKLEKAEGHLELLGSAEAAVRRVRAMTPAPGAFVLAKEVRLGVTAAREAPPACFRGSYETAAPGTVLAVSHEGIFVRMGTGVFVIEALKAPGKRAMSVADYLKGNGFDKETSLA